MVIVSTHGKRIQQTKFVYWVCAALILLGGIAIYFFFRNPNIILFNYIPKPGIINTFHIPVRKHSLLLSILLYNVPDGLWFLSGLLVIRAVWLINQKWRMIYACIFALIAVMMETLQMTRFVPGTFDVLDLVSMAFFAFLESIIFNIFVKRSVL
ncbi:MAG: hypothetical protein FWF29_09860 [Treponema sp.]|nr:hypothetical protein [Treponema sp.]